MELQVEDDPDPVTAYVVELTRLPRRVRIAVERARGPILGRVGDRVRVVVGVPGMIAVQVGDEDEVGVGPIRAGGAGADPAQRPDAPGEQRIGEHDPPAQLDPHRRVAEEPQGEIAHVSSIARGVAAV